MLDLRVEDMILHPNFFEEIFDFARLLVEKGDEYSLKINPLYRSIGFLETINYLQSLYTHTKPNDISNRDPEVFPDYNMRKGVKN